MTPEMAENKSDFKSFESIPATSTLRLDKAKQDGYATLLKQIPKNIRTMAISAKTAAFIRGVANSYDISIEKSRNIAFAVLQVAIGERQLAQLPAMLSSELQLPNDKAQKIADEIEKELFDPIKTELMAYLAQKKQSQPSPAEKTAYSGSMQNLLNLKETKKPNSNQ